jgi:hypothetical protein
MKQIEKETPDFTQKATTMIWEGDEYCMIEFPKMHRGGVLTRNGLMVDKFERRFVGGYSPVTKQQMLLIANYMWWTANEPEILSWMDANLPRGRDHQTGMILTFDTEQDLMLFLLRWQA